MCGIAHILTCYLLLSFSNSFLRCMSMICRLSLQYHPDKNKNKGAQEKFAEINNGSVIATNFFLFPLSLYLGAQASFFLFLSHFSY